MSRPATVVFTHRGRDWIRGSEQCLLDLIENLDPARFASVVLCDQPTLADVARALGAQAIIVPNWGVGPVVPANVRRHLATVLRDVGPSVIHANEAVGTLPAVIPVARALRVPVVAHLHLPTTRTDRLHGLIHQASVCVGVSEYAVAGLRQDGLGWPHVRVIYNAVNTERLGGGDATDLRDTLDIPRDAVVLTSVGSLIERKGHDVTVRALGILAERGVAAHLLLCGDGEQAETLSALARTAGVSERVHCLGYRRDVGAVLRDATDLYVTSAREETLGLNVLEAQAIGRAVVASDIPPHREALDVDRTGVLVAPESPVALADALTELARDPARRAALGAAGRTFTAKRFSMAQYVGGFASLYDELGAVAPARYGWLRGTRWPRAYSAWLLGAVRRRLSGPRP